MKDNCYCCGSSNLQELPKFKQFNHMVCNQCGYENFFSLDFEISSEMYEDDPDYDNELAFAGNYKNLLQWNHHTATRFLLKNKNQVEKVLDIGTFNGFFVKHLINHGFDAFGIDFNRKAIDFGINNYDLGSRISSDNLEKLIDAGKKFDAITLFEVIEHIHGDPSEFIYQISKLLSPEGHLIISTPNSKMIWRPSGDFPPQHLSRFTPLALSKCVEKAKLIKYQSFEQMNSFDLIRNYAGSNLFRSKSEDSLKGGELKNKAFSNLLRYAANKLRLFFYFILSPVDLILYKANIRYMCQIIISKLNN